MVPRSTELLLMDMQVNNQLSVNVAFEQTSEINPLNAELNPICHFLALLEGATVVDGSGLRVNS